MAIIIHGKALRTGHLCNKREIVHQTLKREEHWIDNINSYWQNVIQSRTKSYLTRHQILRLKFRRRIKLLLKLFSAISKNPK